MDIMDKQIEPTAPQADHAAITNIRDLLTPDQQAVLDQDLQEMHQTRVRNAGAVAVSQHRY
jgi:hypothetical protein